MSGVASNLSELAAYHSAEERRYMAIHSAMNTRQDEERAEPELCRMDADWRKRIERLTAMRARTPAEIAAKSAVAKVTYDRLAPLGVLGEEADRLLQSLFRDIAEMTNATV